MSTEVALYKLSEMQQMAEAVARSNLFGMKSPDQALALMLVAQAEGQHPATITQDYDIIQGKACRKTHSVMARFQSMGGRVEWHHLTNEIADATFSHPSGGSLRIEWTFEQARKAGLTNKDNWKNYPRAMLRARVIAEGVRAIYPAAIGGMLVAEEAADTNERELNSPPPRQTGQQAAEAARARPAENVDQEARASMIADLEIVASEQGIEAYAAAWQGLTAAQRKMIGADEHERLKKIAQSIHADYMVSSDTAEDGHE